MFDFDFLVWKWLVFFFFKWQWVDFGYGDEMGKFGVFFKYLIVDVDFFFLDCCYYC